MLGILPDKLGNIWIGTYTGPKIFDLESKRLMPVNKMIGYMKPAGSEEAIYCIKDDKKGGLYLGGHLLTHITDIKKARNGDVSFKWDTLRLPLNNVFAGIRDVLPVGNNLWLASDNKGLFRYNTITKTLTNYASVKDDSTTISYNGINKLFLDSKGRLWIATFHGLSVMDTLTGKIRRIYIDGERDLRKSQTQFVGGIAEDSTGKIWVATRYASLWVMDNSGTFTLFNKLHSFEPLCVWDILKAPNGKLWLNTGSGLCSLDPVTYSSVLFKQVDGFVNTPELGDMKIDRNGILYVGDDGYLHLVNTWNERPVSEVPKMHITSVMANGNSVPLKDYNNIKIRYEQNRVQFEFVGVRYANSKGVQYRYMLEGYDKNWIMNASKRYATYTNLPPGNYEFRVMAAGEDMKWWDCSEKVKITILTPWYMAWWFYLICAALLVGGPYAIYRYRLNNILKLQKIRLNIAADLHDEVGSTLSSISMLSQVAEKKSADGNTRQLLKQISENSSEIQESMSDIVWSINPNNDELANILARMRIFASELLEPLDIDFSFEVNEEAYSVSLPMSLRKDFYLIFKEAVNNAAKYAHCAAVTVSLRVKNKKLQMVIADNGIGIPANSGSANGNGKHRGNGGNGMKNMEIRAAKMGGNIEIVNGEAGGTKVVLEIPIVT
jgi:ligand-binding sensor domain-containing protein/two-component sensor histidine kinase